MDGSPCAVALVPGMNRFEGFSSSEVASAWWPKHPSATVCSAWPSDNWPFVFPFVLDLPDTATIVIVPDFHEAFVNSQTAGTRLVTTQPSYLAQAWLAAIKGRSVMVLGWTDTVSLAAHAPDLFNQMQSSGYGIETDEIKRAPEASQRTCSTPGQVSSDAIALLARAVRASDPAERLTLCVQALDHGRVAPALLATASACMEVNDLDAAARDLDEALEQAPEWAAAHFERGKLWLRLDDMERASLSFRAAADRMPNFGSAWANLGATLGELDRPREALEAFQQALRCDPSSDQALNNVGVVNRELGNLAESEAAFQRVIQLAPDLAFGYYNLGHTLFLQGRYQAALSAYVEGQKRDRERNPVQASRLALCRLAVGDSAGALRELQRATNGLPRDYRQQLLADTNSIAWALLTHRPELPGWKQVNDWLSGELARQA